MNIHDLHDVYAWRKSILYSYAKAVCDIRARQNDMIVQRIEKKKIKRPNGRFEICFFVLLNYSKYIRSINKSAHKRTNVRSPDSVLFFLRFNWKLLNEFIKSKWSAITQGIILISFFYHSGQYVPCVPIRLHCTTFHFSRSVLSYLALLIFWTSIHLPLMVLMLCVSIEQY